MHPHHPPPRRPRDLTDRLTIAGIVLAPAALLLIGLYLYADYPLILISLVVLLAGAGVARAYVGVLAYYNRHARLETVKADKIIELKRAEVQVAPLASSFSYHNAPCVQGLEREVPPPALPAPTSDIPTFAQLLSSGAIGPGRPLILGVDAESHTAIGGSWKDLYSCGIGGLQGGGKSWLAAFLLAQSAAQGGRLIVCDPHAGDEESLAARIRALSPAFMCDVAQSPDAILAALKLANDKLERRKADSSLAQWPIIVVVDEWTSLLRGKLGDVLPVYAENFAEQGRKYNVNALLSAQGWTKDVTGAVRNRLTSHYVLRQRPDEARYQLGLMSGQCPLDVRFLPDATGYLLTVRGELKKVIIPRMTEADLATVGAMIAAPAAAIGLPFGFRQATALSSTPSAYGAENSRKVAGSRAATTAPGTATMVSPEAVRAAALFVAGSSPAEIVKELRGIGSKEGSRYQAALNEVLDLIRTGMTGGTHDPR